MKTQTKLFLIPTLALSIAACSGEKEETSPSTPLAEQSLEFEIYDSLVVDHLGNLALMDISPDGQSYLLRDQNTDTLLLANAAGEILHQYKLSGEGPNQYKENLYGKSKFLNNEEFLTPTTGGVYRYNSQGILQKKYEPGFSPRAQIIITGADNLIIHDDEIYLNLPGRGSDEFGPHGIAYQEKSNHIEVLNLESEEFSPEIKFPSTSKFSSTEKAYKFYSTYPTFSIADDSLYITYRHEPKIFAYPLADLSTLGSTKFIPIKNFVENEPKSDQVDDNINISELYAGTINKIIAMENQHFIIDYLSGLTGAEYDEAVDKAGGDMDKQWDELGKVNQGGLVIFDGTALSNPITKPALLGQLDKYVSKEEIWFSLNFSAAENDYSVIYKTRLVQK
ncbi:hypothetical protein PBT90_14775 [Algoriphagus halophytocola]|uniref:DUF4221 domain-containing protein n=1 Tax=Algoriphagus halophytocola TaxID=2991499 RepID=A0ABY6MNB2_9BACT|nr:MULTISPECIES: hypothetical protein [unclassified Algoriphagus]UZD24643.1 hypothetical protein OM944_09110 [Algoriphagus sp. TR-M5]WBL42011.1 hypothetical protein PBT90_14775 [Algoriphagus sp. TR-M9]